MDKLVIKGPCKVSGKIPAGGSKNCALPVLFATLLSKEEHIIKRVPRLADMDSTMKMLVHLGAEISQKHASDFGCDWTVSIKTLRNKEAPYDLVRKMRASNLCLGPLLVREGSTRVSLPGGCAIGARPMDLHLMALEKLGAKVVQEAGYIEARIPTGESQLRGGHVIFPFVSVGATENVVMAATLAKGETIIENAAREPEVRDLCEALISMGAKIEGHGTSKILVQGVSSLRGMNFVIPPDRIEVATYLIAAHMSGGDVEVMGAKHGDLTHVLDLLEATGAKVERRENSIRVSSDGKITPVDITTAPYPAFPTDIQAQWMALMTQAQGASVVSEQIFENRFMHVPELVRMGAKLKVRGNTVEVEGTPGALQGAPVMATDLRASASLVLAGIVAKGSTEVKRIYHLDRGYESMENKLRALGVDVERTVDS
ncbi:MAG TPA: UDP-N-acetylglucosamine 1-carboxyvinyltransferase [Bdellovibrionota bacterium]|nr:UDP-N-acetylglucosamine 1-carboxyvinyltransferase [Bdellovibrionota bacterium]